MKSKQKFVVDGVGLQLEGLPRPLVWSELYGNSNPVELEIGMGKATFLTGQAKGRPETNFFGIEWANWFWRYGTDRLRRNGCTNARTIRAEAAFFLREYVQPETLSVLHIYFPDPWPKAKHNRRRLIQAPFLELAERVLVPGGMLKVVTDHLDYWQQIEPVVKGSKLKVVEYARPESANEGEVVGTNFERKYILEGRPFHAIAAVKA